MAAVGSSVAVLERQTCSLLPFPYAAASRERPAGAAGSIVAGTGVQGPQLNDVGVALLLAQVGGEDMP